MIISGDFQLKIHKEQYLKMTMIDVPCSGRKMFYFSENSRK